MNDQNESPFSNPKFLTSIVLVFIFLWGWQYYVSKKYPPPILQVATAQNTTSTAAKVSDKTPSTEPTQLLEADPSKTIQNKSYSYEDDQVKWELSSQGMGLSFFELKKYTDKHKKPILYSTDEKQFSVKTNKKLIQFELTQVSDVEYVGKAMVDGVPVVRTIKYNKEKSFFESITEFQKGVQELSFTLSDLKHKPESTTFFMPSFEKQDFLYREGEKIKSDHISSLKDGETFQKSGNQISLASINSQYFSQAIVDKSEINPSINMNVQGGLAFLSVDYDLKNTQIGKITQLYFLGPKSTEAMQKIDPLLPEVMDYGMFGFISKPLLVLMRFLHQFLGNWGLAIIALTLVVRLVMLPFNILSFKSSRAMQKIQPQLQALREKYKNDPMRVNKETMALMKEQKANPLSGCLPMLIQIPIFFALWRTIGSSIDIYQQPFFGWITDLSVHDHFFVLPILGAVTMFFQQKLTPSTMDPAQQKILNFMPILFGLFMFSLPSGLTLYNFISALFGATQQYFLLKDNSAKKIA